MNNQEREAILTIALMAAFADGNNNDQERNEIKRIVDALGAEGGINTAAIYQNVLLKKVTLASVANSANFSSPEMKTLAYEFAVGVCDADGAHSPQEKAFLDELRNQLAIDAKSADAFTSSQNSQQP
jgi:tellurite resistance protein